MGLFDFVDNAIGSGGGGGFDPFSAIGGSVLGTVGTYLLNENADSNARSREGDNFIASAQQYAHRYQTTTADMKAAGLNPILAATGGFSVGNTPQVTPVSSPSGQGSAADFSSSAKNFAEVDKIHQEIKVMAQSITESEKRIEVMSKGIEVSDAQIEKLKTEIPNLEQATSESRAREKTEAYRQANLDATTQGEYAKIDNLAKDTLLKAKQIEQTQEAIHEIQQNIAKSREETKRAIEQTKESRAMQGQIRQYTNTLKQSENELAEKTKNLEALRRGINANADSAEAIAVKLKNVNKFYEGIGGIPLSAIRAAADAIGFSSVSRLQPAGE